MKNINDKLIKKILKALDNNDGYIVGDIYNLFDSKLLEKCIKDPELREDFCYFLKEEIYDHVMNEKTIARILRIIDERR